MSFFGISARNEGQKRLGVACKSQTPIVIGTGRAGTGKSLIAQAVGFDAVFEEKRWGSKEGKFVYTRLQVDVGKAVGFLPGTLQDKSNPYFRPFWDNLTLLDNGDYMKNHLGRRIFLDTIQTVRGGTYHDSYLVVDECQNLDNDTMTAIGTRLALGDKLILLGNFAQIDTPSLKNPKNNGFYKLLKGLYDEEAYDMFTHVHLTKGERGPIADLVERIMVPESEINSVFTELEQRGLIA